MKILFLGSMMSEKMADEITIQSKVKPSIAPVNFQRNLLKGFSHRKAEVEIHSVPPVAMYPGSKIMAWGRRKEEYYEGMTGQFLPIINLPVLKQLSTFISTFFCTVGWCTRNLREKEKVVLVYGQNAYVAIPQVFACKIFGVKSCNIVTDPIRYISNYNRFPKWKKVLQNIQWDMMSAVKCSYSAFVLLTEPMVEEYITKNQPYIVLEGIADTSIFSDIVDVGKEEPPVVMYAGALTTGFGIHNLVKAIPLMKQKAQYWFFGALGDCKEIIAEEANRNSLVKYWGKVPWKEMLKHMKQASVLVSTKPVQEEHTRYQFPSKIMEYMASGTAVASTRVQGIPEEYFDYIYPIDGDDPVSIANVLDFVLSKSEDERKKIGEQAYQFVSEKKNCFVQASRILELLEGIVSK